MKIASRGQSAGFTLLELLVVIAVIAVLMVAIIPAVNSLSKSSGRKAGMSNLLGAIEQARTNAIKTGRPSYVAFPADLPSGTDAATVQRYSYKSYAIFEDDPANLGVPKQLTSWKTLPTGVSLRSKNDSGAEKFGGLAALPASQQFAFQPLNSALPLPHMKFSASGEIESPATEVWLAVFEGSVDSGAELVTGAKDSYQNPLATETLKITRTGRAAPTVTPNPTS